MPELLSVVCPSAKVIMDRPVTDRPHLAGLAMEAISSWSKVEYTQLRLFVQMLGGHETIAASVYLALDGRGPKNAAVTAAASFLTEERRDLLTALLQIGKSNEKGRDALAHGLWCISDQLPDALLLQTARGPLATRIDRSKIYVYREVDFNNIIATNQQLQNLTFAFKAILQSDPLNADASLCEKLSKEPLIAERLCRLKAKASQTPPA